MRSRKRKWFWAARDTTTSDIWDHYGVSLFAQNKRPSNLDSYGDGEWRDADGGRGGKVCYGIFCRLTGVTLKPGQVKIVYMPDGAFKGYEIHIKPS